MGATIVDSLLIGWPQLITTIYHEKSDSLSYCLFAFKILFKSVAIRHLCDNLYAVRFFVVLPLERQQWCVYNIITGLTLTLPTNLTYK